MTLYSGNYWKRSLRVRQTATANPHTLCARCGRTLADHPLTHTGQPPTWTAGHRDPNDSTSPLQPEVLSCNVAERNQRINHTTPLITTRRW